MTTVPADTSSRPWDFVQRGLAAVGISGRGLVIAAPALWMTLFFLVPLAVVFGISLSVKQFGQPPYSDLLTTESGTVQLTLHLSNYLKLIEGSIVDGGFWFNLAFNLIVAALALVIARGLSRSVEPLALFAIYAVAVVAGALFLVTLYTADLNVYLTAFLSSIRIAAISQSRSSIMPWPGMASMP